MRVSIREFIAGFMLIPVLVSCSADMRGTPIELRFAAAAGGATLHNLQFYVYDIELLDEKGLSHPMKMAGPVALVDLAGDPKTPRTHSIPGTVGGKAIANYRTIRFTVGVPFALNHANPLTASAPLNRGDLQWAWQTGYKFLRADFALDQKEASFHLGSTGCSSASALRPPAAPCAQPNRMRIELVGDPLTSVILFHPLALGNGTCTGNYAQDPACATGYASTALLLDTGKCADEYCSAQKLWTLE